MGSEQRTAEAGRLSPEMVWSADKYQAELEREVQRQLDAALAAERTRHKKAEQCCIYWLYITIGYGFAVTLFAGICRPGFQEACIEFSQTITRDILPGVIPALDLTAGIAHLADLIPYDEWSVVLYWAIVLIMCGTLIWCVRWCGGKMHQFALFYKHHMADWISLEVSLISIAAAVFFSEPMQSIGINSIAAVLLANTLYTAVRGLIICRSAGM